MRSVVRRSIIAGLFVISVGFVSAVTSRRSCEAAASARIARELGGHTVFVLPEDRTDANSYPEAELILKRNGFQTMPCVRSNDTFDCWPWAGVRRALVIAPFLVEVEWGFVAAPLSGYGTRTRYVALFAAVFALGDAPGWVT